MLLAGALEKSHKLISTLLKPGDKAVDATAGNGKDTLLLAHLVGSSGKVYSVDIQTEAIKKTSALLKTKGFLDRVELIQADHSHLSRLVPVPVKAVMFNLGYLPGGDHNIITRPESTIKAVESAINITEPGGLITIVAYHGHPGGKEELEALEGYLANLDQEKITVLEYRFLNQVNNPPVLLTLEMET